jgi:chitinase
VDVIRPFSDHFPTIAASATTRTAFANACVQLIQQYKFDGIDIDWEYLGYAPNSGTAADKRNFTLFLQAIRTALTNLGVQTGKTYTLTACFSAAPAPMANIEWANIVPILDCINLRNIFLLQYFVKTKFI